MKRQDKSWKAAMAVALSGVLLASGCGGAPEGPLEAAHEDSSDSSSLSDSTGCDEEDGEGPEEGHDDGQNDGYHDDGCKDGKCEEKVCFDLWEEQDISFVQVHVPCPLLVKKAYLFTKGEILHPKPYEPSNCRPNLVGFKFEGVNAHEARVCVEFEKPIDPDAITLQVKTGAGCFLAVEGYGECRPDHSEY